MQLANPESGGVQTNNGWKERSSILGLPCVQDNGPWLHQQTSSQKERTVGPLSNSPPKWNQWEMIYSWPRRQDLKRDIIDRIVAWESRLKPMKRGRISSQRLQYVKNAEELQWPCIMTTHGSTPSNKRKVVPPILNPWPRTLLSPAIDHTSRQQSRNQV